MDIKALKYLLDIQTSIEAIDIHLGSNRNFFDYKKNLTIKRAVIREFEITN
jgi:hypothetical protein